MNNVLKRRALVNYVANFNRAKIASIRNTAVLPTATSLFNRSLNGEIPKSLRLHSSRVSLESQQLDDVEFDTICEETLDGLTEYIEELIESDATIKDSDVTYSSGVLTITLGESCTYVINKQSPNKQIWLSSPTSGPKRFDYSIAEKCWVYKHSGQTLHQLLQDEMPKILKVPNIDFSRCSFSKL